MESIKDRVHYLVYADIPYSDYRILEDIKPVLPSPDKTKDIENRIIKKDAQSINTYHELIVGKSFLGFSQSYGYKLEYESNSLFNSNKTPDWTISSENETVLIEVATKHISNLTLIKQAFIWLIADRFSNVAINYTHFVLPYFDKEKPDYDELQKHCDDLFRRLDSSIGSLSNDKINTTCVDGLKITIGSTPQTNCLVGSTPSRFLLSIAEKAEKYKQLSQDYPLIIVIVSKNLIRGGGISPRMMAELLYGTIGDYHPEQFNICECDHQKLEVMRPSINKIAGIIFCDMHNYNQGALSYEYYPNPHKVTTGKIYCELLTYLKGQSDETQK